MPKHYDAITGNDVVDISLADFQRSAHQLAKEFRGVSQVSRSLVLFDVLHHGEHCPATVPKKGHNSLVRLMLVTRDEMVKLQALRDEIAEDPTATIADKLNAAKAIQKGLADLTDAALKIEAAAEDAAKKSTDFLVKLAEFRQKDRHHQDKMKMDISSLSSDEIEAKLKAISVESIK
jgi:hypothetical protein